MMLQNFLPCNTSIKQHIVSVQIAVSIAKQINSEVRDQKLYSLLSTACRVKDRKQEN